MGQRFQAYYLMTQTEEGTNRVKLHREAFHLQWSWGIYSLMRLEQVMNFMTKQLVHEKTPFHAGFEYQLSETILPILENLTSMNGWLGSYEEVDRLEPEEAEDAGSTDNDDGFFVVDLREDRPRYRLFLNDWDSGMFKAVTPEVYMNHYPDQLESHAELVQEVIGELDQYDTISDETLIELYPKLEGSL